MTGELNLDALLKRMKAELVGGVYVFATLVLGLALPFLDHIFDMTAISHPPPKS